MLCGVGCEGKKYIISDVRALFYWFHVDELVLIHLSELCAFWVPDQLLVLNRNINAKKDFIYTFIPPPPLHTDFQL